MSRAGDDFRMPAEAIFLSLLCNKVRSQLRAGPEVLKYNGKPDSTHLAA